MHIYSTLSILEKGSSKEEFALLCIDLQEVFSPQEAKRATRYKKNMGTQVRQKHTVLWLFESSLIPESSAMFELASHSSIPKISFQRD